MTDPRHPAGIPGQPQQLHPNHPQPQHAQRPMPAAPVPHLPSHAAAARPGIAPLPVQSIKAAPHDADLDPIELVDEDLAEIALPDQTPAVNKPKIKAFGPDLHRREHQWKRSPHISGQGAIRVKSFHGKYSDQGLEHMDDVINEWLDAHPEVEVKFVTSTVNVFEGKIREPALVLNLWY
jgi:hypothetical protein